MDETKLDDDKLIEILKLVRETLFQSHETLKLLQDRIDLLEERCSVLSKRTEDCYAKLRILQ
jgi:chaperonin cofactor prefoldin